MLAWPRSHERDILRLRGMSNERPDTQNSPPERGPGRRRLLRILLIQLGILIFLVEILLRLVPVPGFTRAELAPPFLDSEQHRRLGPHPYLGVALKPDWRSREGQKQASHNSHGLRGAEVTLARPQGVRRVVCLGGSSTYGNGPSSDERTWPARLEAILNEERPSVPVQVINAGVPSWSTYESLINLAFRMVEFDPDLVVVYHATNDAACALYGEPVPDNTHYRAVWPIVRPSPLEPLLERSMTYLVWRKYFTDYLELRADLDYYVVRDYDPRVGYQDPYGDGPFPRRGFQSFERNLRSIVAVARAHGARLLLVTQASHSDGSDSYNTGRNRHRAIAELTESTRRLAQELDVSLVDAKSVLEAEATSQIEAGGKQNIFRLGGHLRDPGAELLARTIAAHVVAEDLLP